jgi:8-oxo-dGTP pyrophosphatase MutT (NUDIX family)
MTMQRFMSWYPHKTVAVVVEQNNDAASANGETRRFLMVEERVNGRLVINQPAGHLDSGESLPEAAVRETRDETGWQGELTALIGLYQYTSAENGECYIRTCFAARALTRDPAQELDEGIVAAHWMTRDELRQQKARLRSPVVLRVIDDYLKGQLYPLEIVVNIDNTRDKA